MVSQSDPKESQSAQGGNSQSFSASRPSVDGLISSPEVAKAVDPKLFQLVLMDVDGTLVDQDKTVATQSVHILQDLKRQGVQIALCSGRGPGALEPVLEQAGLDPIYVALNGALVFVNHQIISKVPLSRQAVWDAWSILKEKQAKVIFVTESGLFRNFIPSPEWEKQFQSGSLREQYEVICEADRFEQKISDVQDEILKIAIMEEDPDQLARIEQKLAASSSFGVTRSDVDYIDLHPLGVNKGYGLGELCRYLGIDPALSVAIGDNENDVSMFAKAGWSIAMCNAPAAVRQAADQVTTLDHNHAGAAIALNDFFTTNQEGTKWHC